VKEEERGSEGRGMGKEKRGKGGRGWESIWNRAADWLRPALDPLERSQTEKQTDRPRTNHM